MAGLPPSAGISTAQKLQDASPWAKEYVLADPTIRITAKGLEALHQKLSRGSELALVGNARGEAEA